MSRYTPKKSDFHIICEGDTFEKIATKYGFKSAELKRINGMNKITRKDFGRRIALRKEAVCGIQGLVLDAERHPIRGIKYRICVQKLDATRKLPSSGTYDQKKEGKTGVDGLTVRIITESPRDLVDFWVWYPKEGWKLVRSGPSGYGERRITMLSPYVLVKAKTAPHEKKPGEIISPTMKEAPRYDPGKDVQVNPEGEVQAWWGKVSEKFGWRVKDTKTKEGKPVAVVTADGLDLSSLDHYTGEILSEKHFKDAADELGIEVALIKAINEVEAGSSGFMKIGKVTVPKILYERHKFHKFTNGKYTQDNPDLSYPTPYILKKGTYVKSTMKLKSISGEDVDFAYYKRYNKKTDKAEDAISGKQLLGEKVRASGVNTYAAGEENYKRLMRSQKLDKEAAYMCCSWGAFQILGEYATIMGYASAVDFGEKMSQSEAEQLKAFVLYCQKISPGIIPHMKDKNFAGIARAYNGPGYKDYNYDTKIENAYKKWSQK
ncbi:LysM peptidoglycan-binding domain-containing protein [Chitinimonas sp. PSY-7]|uniref:N-acetylmuramidase domain-containing protein n=1 Tax=Chitinimonas sp. PSY-7 TaxID=3459088 RepID=UPI00403FD709